MENGFETNSNGNGWNGNGHWDHKPVGDQRMDGRLVARQPMTMGRFFTYEGKNPFQFDICGNPIKWVSENVSVNDDAGKPVFTQEGVKRPDFWSSLAVKIVASKYFWGDIKKSERESSIEMLIGRVARFFERQAVKQGYFNEEQARIFKDELAAICLNQLAVFNSPVWFNAGIQEYDVNAGGVSAYMWDSANGKVIKAIKQSDKPQCSACFIQSIKDDMESIMEVQVAEANLFKAGSGTGTNRSPLRSSKEHLTGGGRASGPVSFMRGYDAYAGVIKSGGKTRRAAKMEILNIEHPDIVEFIEAKSAEEKKAWALIEQGYDGGMNGQAYSSVAFQNCNMSVRVSDEFMKAVKENSVWSTKFVKTGKVCETMKAADLMRKIAEGTHICGDPGMQFDTTVNKWHTCKNTARINASNPCSEYMFVDDSACNLASINLLKFMTAEGKFDVEKFRKVVRAFIIAQELIIDGASYPTAKIAQNSHDYRPLGLGYANLGALLMSLGLPYDSEAGRAVAGTLTAIMTGEAYRTSAELAGLVGPFTGFAQNREPMLQVIEMHRDAVKEIDVEAMPPVLRYLVNDAWDMWTDAIELGYKNGYRNAQTTVLAPTGTIAFMMDCATTGIEPDIGLVKYKVLDGGGMLKIVNTSVHSGLRKLGYGEDKIKEIVDYINKNETIEGAPHLIEEHLPVFDCAFKATKGKRSIHYKGHVQMMAAAQPFISGAISKTVNVPEDVTVDEILKTYIYAWEQGLKAVAIYRENSKRVQPLNIKKKEQPVEEKFSNGERYKLPQTRRSITHKFEIAGHEGYITVGLYDDGKPGEIFITMHKQGSTIRGLLDAWATSVSVNLQYGVSITDLFKRFRHQKFEPAGFVKNLAGGEIDNQIKQIRTASSIVDYVAQFMMNNFGDGAGGMHFDLSGFEEIDTTEQQASLEEFSADEGIACPICGGVAKRIGNCEIMCTSCKQTTRSGCGE
ncbi:MAG: vitamin B12-dependent ribonucleotide reductase [Nanoarchaeota archaeon]|nr:vitamin B12-dependent ribonucleotide reductase [Nanoarchaeota archaeon]MBU0976915.1 vitamin B12-dependent ribonucleotide reductase [Nanoarchaeota archaeon]